MILAAAHHGPHIDWAALSPLVALTVGACVVLMVGLLGAGWARRAAVPALTVVSLAVFLALTIGQFDDHKSILSGALRIDGLALVLDIVLAVAGISATLLALRSRAAEEAGHGELYGLLLFCILGMAILVAAQNTITLFLGLELLSIPLYILCASELRSARSLESGLKYLVVGSVGSATLLYGLALLYGASGSTDFGAIGQALGGGDIGTDALTLTGIALVVVGLAFKCSVAPFHQWTPDVYEGAPTPITAFMAVATKVAAFGVFLRFFDTALIADQATWAPILAVLATITIIVGNVGALGQSSLKRMLAWSSVAQAGYVMAGVIVGTSLGVKATVFYLAVYLFMNLAAFAVIVARERETEHGDDVRAIAGIGASRPVLGVALTISMLSLAGLPATAGFIGKVYLIEALVDGNYAWLAIVLVVGSMISLAYYMRVVAAVWGSPAGAEAGAGVAVAVAAPPARPAIAGAEEGAERSHVEVVVVAALAAAATVFFGIVPGPLLHLVGHVGGALGGLF